MTDPNITTELDSDGILVARVDMPGRAMNVFSASMMDSLEALLKRAEADDAVRGVVLASGKSAFIAGADLEMIKMFAERARSASTAELHGLFGHLGRLFRRIELCRKPWITAINGLALGGGLEVAMACHERVAADDEKAVQLGLPEIKLGLLPGAGGTQRLPRLVGTAKGLEMLLIGEPVGPAEALKLGLVEEVVPAGQLIAAAKRRARALTAPRARWDRAGYAPQSAPYDFSDAAAAAAAIATKLGISDYQLAYYPAYRAILNCTIGGWSLAMGDGTRHEMDIFVELMRDPVAGNMVRTLFLNRQKAQKLGVLAKDSPLATGDGALLPSLRAAQEAAAARDEAGKLAAVTLAALRARAAGKLGDIAEDFADVAAVLGGCFPSYAGGPYAHARALGREALRAQAAGDAAILAAIDAYLGAEARVAAAA